MLTSRSQKFTLALVASLSIALISVGAANAADRWASPTGSGTTCSQIAPCSISTAINDVTGYDPVVIGSGTYGSLASPVMNLKPALHDQTIRGESPFSRPTIFASNDTHVAAFDTGERADVSDLNIVSVAGPSTYYGLRSPNSSLNRVSVSGSALSATCGGSGDISNTVCFSDSPGVAALSVAEGGSGALVTKSFSYYNVTAVSTNGIGFDVAAGDFFDLNFAIANSIFRGSPNDIAASNSGIGGSDADLDIWSSNFAGVVASGAGTDITNTSLQNNQVATPEFVDVNAGNLRPLATSPTVDAGDDTSLVNPYDVSGSARVYGPHVDIGAYEWSPAPPPTTPTLPGTTPQLVPVLKKPKFSKTSFKAGKSGAAVQPAANAKKKSNKGIGSTVSISSSQIGTVHFTLFRVAKKNGKTIYKQVKGVESATLAVGTNKFWFSGRWSKKKLAPGKYQLRGTPTVKGNTIKTTTGDEPGTVRGPTSTVVK